MIVPSCAAALTLTLLTACGGTVDSSNPNSEQPSEPPSTTPLPSAERLLGEWQQEYLTAGALSMSSKLRFEANGVLTRDAASMTSFTDPKTVTHFQGFYRDLGLGAVEYEWNTEASRVQHRHDLTFVEGALLAHRCCNRASPRSWWTHRGYLATNLADSKFYRAASERIFELDGTPRSSLDTRVELTFSDAPTKLLGRSDGVLELAISIDSRTLEGSERQDVRITLPCRVQADGGETLVVLFPGWDSAQGRPLTEQAYIARRMWREIVAQEEVDTTGWSERALAELYQAFEPYLAFDRAQPHFMVHTIDWNSFNVTGYARVGD